MASKTEIARQAVLHSRPGVLFGMILAAGFALRLILVLTHDGYLGVDGGAYIDNVTYVLTGETAASAFPRPPLAPGWLLVAFTELWGVDIGYKVWAAIFSLSPVIPVYLLTRRHVGPWAGVFTAGLAVLDLSWGEMMVTGALPLIGFALLGMAFWALGGLAERFSRRDAVILSLSIGLIPWINQTTAGIAVIMLPTYFLALLWFQRRAIDYGRPSSNGLN